MLDEVQRLRETQDLVRLLAHYVELGAADREAWQDRLMAMEGLADEDLIQLHGELLAFDWIDQNTGVTPVLRPGVISCCYRVTPAGRRALKRARAAGDLEDFEAEAA